MAKWGLGEPSQTADLWYGRQPHPGVIKAVQTSKEKAQGMRYTEVESLKGVKGRSGLFAAGRRHQRWPSGGLESHHKQQAPYFFNLASQLHPGVIKAVHTLKLKGKNGCL